MESSEFDNCEMLFSRAFSVFLKQGIYVLVLCSLVFGFFKVYLKLLYSILCALYKASCSSKGVFSVFHLRLLYWFPKTLFQETSFYIYVVSVYYVFL